MKPNSNEEYPDFVSTTHYGEVQGICGANCKHSYYTFIPGVSTPTYTKEELKKMNDKEKEKISYKGKEYTYYEATQYQRQLENEIRKLKRQALLEKETGLEQDFKTTNSQIKALRKEYKQFSEASEISAKMNRTQI